MLSDYLIILNPAANDRKTKNNWKKVENILQDNDIKYTLKVTRKKNHAKEILNYYIRKWKKIKKFPKAIIIIGGDGTLNEVLSAIYVKQEEDRSIPDIPISILPFGKNNNFAKEHGIKRNNWKKEIVKLIKKPVVNDLSIGIFYENIKNQYGVFHNNIGIGLDANVVNLKSTIGNKSKFNKITKLISLIPLLYKIDSFESKIKIDNNKNYYFSKTIMCTVSQSNNNMNLIVIEKRNIIRLVYTLMLVIIGKHFKMRSIHKFTGNEISITIPSLEYGQVDGEQLGSRFYDIDYKITKYPFII
ncbi:hypothetical protein MOO46_02780 [Apilactobacillus apisilvae]|uniref:DAGKc domain-containing protein n=1 Tax=Apilactobacillus apisilvae TaxID=2923364 RepID=A0ABY4PJ35_9LACO|nr:diacylglycerol kinase family protein [Apilactobacillus apisilvae]UQS85528.1 hypothetical protein MOO46_02780 [Apilactobacillus apisilvae]